MGADHRSYETAGSIDGLPLKIPIDGGALRWFYRRMVVLRTDVVRDSVALYENVIMDTTTVCLQIRHRFIV